MVEKSFVVALARFLELFSWKKEMKISGWKNYGPRSTNKIMRDFMHTQHIRYENIFPYDQKNMLS